MLTLGTLFWPRGPQTLDWTIDLASGSFGPLHLGSTADEIKAALGRPDRPQFFGVGSGLYYQRFALWLWLDENQCIDDFQFDIPERDDEPSPSSPSAFETTSQTFDPSVKLPGTSSCRLRRLTIEDFERPFASYRFDANECYREWARHDIVIYLDLLEDNRTISSLGLMKNDE